MVQDLQKGRPHAALGILQPIQYRQQTEFYPQELTTEMVTSSPKSTMFQNVLAPISIGHSF